MIIFFNDKSNQLELLILILTYLYNFSKYFLDTITVRVRVIQINIVTVDWVNSNGDLMGSEVNIEKLVM